MKTSTAPQLPTKRRWFSWPVLFCALAAICLIGFLALPATDGPPPQRSMDLLSIHATCALPSIDRVEQEIGSRGSWELQETPGSIARDDPCSKLVSGITITASGAIRIQAKIAEVGQYQSSSKPFEAYKRKDVLIELTPQKDEASKISWKHKGLPAEAFPKSYNE